MHSITGDTVRLTMVTPTPYGAGAAGSSASFTCFRSNPDTDVTLSFDRPFLIGIPGSTIATYTSLPTGSTESTNGSAVTQDLTSSNDATGLFYCEGTNRGLTTRVYSIIHSVHSKYACIQSSNSLSMMLLVTTLLGSKSLPQIRNVRFNFQNDYWQSGNLPVL